PSVPETRTGSSYGSDVSSNNPANAPIPPSTSGRFVFAICFFIRSTASYPFSTSTPAFLYIFDIFISPLTLRDFTCLWWFYRVFSSKASRANSLIHWVITDDCFFQTGFGKKGEAISPHLTNHFFMAKIGRKQLIFS